MRLSTFLLPFLPLVLAEELRVFHRIHHPAASSPSPFLERGSLSLTSTGASLVPHETLAEDLLELAEVSHGLDGAFYQVALEREGDEHEGHWAISSVKACHLPQSTSETFIVHETTNGKPFSVDYFVSPIPHDGACPPKKGSSPPKFRQSSNTTILSRSPRLPPLPELRKPPPLTPEGAPVQPVVEKSFIQKYWIYIVVVLGALLLSGGVEDEAPKEGGK